MKEIIDKIKDFLKKENVLKAAIFIGIIGMILILVSNINSGDEKDEEISLAEENIDFTLSETYSKKMESELKEILVSIDGVGKANVLLTITSTEEYVYAESIKNNSSGSENDYVIIDEGSKKEALIKKINTPQISGVVIVCEGGGNAKTCEKIYKSVSTALGIPTTKIYVTEMK